MNSTFIIAEAGVNHNGDIGLAKELVAIAAESGADAVKFQTFKADRLAASSAEMAEYQVQNVGEEKSQREMLKALELAEGHYQELIEECSQHGIEFMSTPFEEESADFLISLGMKRIKMASGELTNLPFLRHVARKRLPLVISTGMANLGEVELAVETIESEWAEPALTILQCVSNYPASPKSINLRAMQTLASFGYPVGYSDHTNGIGVAIASVALGASVIEKHFTLNRSMEGPDHKASLEPEELSAMVREIRDVEAALGGARKRPNPEEISTASVARKSLVIKNNLPSGHVLREADLVAKRPGTGIPTRMMEFFVGRTLKRSALADELLSLELFE